MRLPIQRTGPAMIHRTWRSSINCQNQCVLVLSFRQKKERHLNGFRSISCERMDLHSQSLNCVTNTKLMMTELKENSRHPILCLQPLQKELRNAITRTFECPH